MSQPTTSFAEMQPKPVKKVAPGSVAVFGSIEQYPTNPNDAAKLLMERGLKIIPFKLRGKTKVPMLKKWSPYRYSWQMIGPQVDQAFGIVVPPGLIVIDLDTNDDGGYVGLDAISQLAEDAGVTDFTWLDTLVTDTPSGGMHLWYRVPNNVRVRNSASKLAKHIDVRVAEKGLVLMPPSLNSEGMPYMFSGTETVAKLPLWLLEKINDAEAETAEYGQVVKAIDYKLLVENKDTAAYIKRRCDSIADAPVGTRNITLNAVAYSIYRRVAGGLLDEYAASTALLNAGLLAGLYEAEILATLRSSAEAAALVPLSAEQLKELKRSKKSKNE